MARYVRELENVLHRAVLIADSNEIKASDISLQERNSELESSKVNSGSETQMIFNTLGYCLGDMSKAANILGVSIDILREKLDHCTKA